MANYSSGFLLGRNLSDNVTNHEDDNGKRVFLVAESKVLVHARDFGVSDIRPIHVREQVHDPKGGH